MTHSLDDGPQGRRGSTQKKLVSVATELVDEANFDPDMRELVRNIMARGIGMNMTEVLNSDYRLRCAVGTPGNRNLAIQHARELLCMQSSCIAYTGKGGNYNEARRIPAAMNRMWTTLRRVYTTLLPIPNAVFDLNGEAPIGLTKEHAKLLSLTGILGTDLRRITWPQIRLVMDGVRHPPRKRRRDSTVGIFAKYARTSNSPTPMLTSNDSSKVDLLYCTLTKDQLWRCHISPIRFRTEKPDGSLTLTQYDSKCTAFGPGAISEEGVVPPVGRRIRTCESDIRAAQYYHARARTLHCNGRP